MTILNPFRVSFDRPLGSRERLGGRISATLVGGAAVLIGAVGVLAILNANSASIGAWSNAKPEQEVRLAAEGASATGKPCQEQVWPNLEARCLKPADRKISSRAVPKPAAARAALPSVPSVPSAARSANASVQETGTTGLATPADRAEAEPSAAIPLPAPDPAPGPAVREAPTNTAAARPSPDRSIVQPRADVKPRITQRERRQTQREERDRRARNDEARRARAERERERAEARYEARYNAWRSQENPWMERRWSEYDGPPSGIRRSEYDAPPSGSRRRVYVDRPDPTRESFFGLFR